jgi:hypothetical protein
MRSSLFVAAIGLALASGAQVRTRRASETVSVRGQPMLWQSSSKNVFGQGPAVNNHGHARTLTTHTLASIRTRPGPSSWTTSKRCVFVG